MDTARADHYLQMAMDHSDILCSDIPLEVLEEAAASGDEPTPLLRDFIATGYIQWLSTRNGRKVRLPKVQLNNAVVVLWLRACRLHTSHLLGRRDQDWDRPFFSDEGLY